MLNDVVIIGNGILGNSAAFAMAQQNPSLKITIIGPQSHTNTATISAGAMLGCFGEISSHTFSHPAHLKKFEISLKAMNLWDNWLDKINNIGKIKTKLKTGNGTYLILNSISGKLDCANYNIILKALKQYEQCFYEVDHNEIPGVLPSDSARPLKSIYLPNEGYIDSSSLLNSLNSALRNMPNISFIDDTVQKINVRSGEIESLELTRTKLSSKKILVAAGTDSYNIISSINELKGKIQPLFSGVGCALVIEQDQVMLNNVVRTPNRSFSCGLHIVPKGNNALYLGATNQISMTKQKSPNIGHIHFLLNCAFEQLNIHFSSANLKSVLVGNRPVSLDTFPLIGKTSVDNLYLLTGTYRDGLHQSPYLAQEIAQCVLDDKPCIDNYFVPERAPISVFTKEQAINEANTHFLSGAYEQSINVPKVGWHKMLQEMMLKKISKIYDDLDMDFILPPDFLPMIVEDYSSLMTIKRLYTELRKHSQCNNNLLNSQHPELHKLTDTVT